MVRASFIVVRARDYCNFDCRDANLCLHLRYCVTGLRAPTAPVAVAFEEGKTVSFNAFTSVGDLIRCSYYVRSESMRLWKQLLELKENHLLCITGPPGVGKTTTVFAFCQWIAVQSNSSPSIRFPLSAGASSVSSLASSSSSSSSVEPMSSTTPSSSIVTAFPLAPGITIRWIGLVRVDDTAFIVDITAQSMVQYFATGVPEIVSFISSFSGEWLIIDGFLKTTDKEISNVLVRWIRSKEQRRRAVLVSSSSAFRIDMRYRSAVHTEDIRVQGWSIEEYKAYLEVKENRSTVPLDAIPVDEDVAVEDQIKAKFYYAGSSARYMLEYTTAQIMKDVSERLLAVDDLDALFSSKVGSDAFNAVGHLRPTSDSFTSQYITRRLTNRFGGDKFLMEAYAVCENNPSMIGWLFQMDVENRIRANAVSTEHSPIQVYQDAAVENWSTAHGFKEFLQARELREIKDDVWLIPSNPQQACYDLLQMVPDPRNSSGKMLRVVEVTKADRHNLKMEHLNKVVRELCQDGHVMTALDVVILVPNGWQKHFKSLNVSGVAERVRLLHPWTNYVSGENVIQKNRVRILGFNPARRFLLVRLSL